jgi:hypothetical protein
MRETSLKSSDKSQRPSAQFDSLRHTPPLPLSSASYDRFGSRELTRREKYRRRDGVAEGGCRRGVLLNYELTGVINQSFGKPFDQSARGTPSDIVDDDDEAKWKGNSLECGKSVSFDDLTCFELTTRIKRQSRSNHQAPVNRRQMSASTSCNHGFLLIFFVDRRALSRGVASYYLRPSAVRHQIYDEDCLALKVSNFHFLKMQKPLLRRPYILHNSNANVGAWSHEDSTLSA